jgi:hypothetical protein
MQNMPPHLAVTAQQQQDPRTWRVRVSLLLTLTQQQQQVGWTAWMQMPRPKPCQLL